MKYFQKPYSLDYDKYSDQLRDDLATFYMMKHDPNTCVGDLDAAYDELCKKIASRLQDLALNAWLDGRTQNIDFQKLKIASEKGAAIIVDLAMNEIEEAINARQG